jgi:hypothetical protein
LIADLFNVAVLGYRLSFDFAGIWCRLHTIVYTTLNFLCLCTIVYTIVLFTNIDIRSMASQAKVKLCGRKSRHSINLPSDFVKEVLFRLRSVMF